MSFRYKLIDLPSARSIKDSDRGNQPFDARPHGAKARLPGVSGRFLHTIREGIVYKLVCYGPRNENSVLVVGPGFQPVTCRPEGRRYGISRAESPWL